MLALSAGASSQERTPDSTQPLPSWIHFFTHAGQWTGGPHGDVFGVVQPSFTRDGGRSWFGFTRARLGVRGALTPTLSFFTLTEMAVNGVTAPTGGAVRLLDAQLNWSPKSFVNFRFGQFLPDLGRLINPGVFVSWIDYTDIEKTVLFFNRMDDLETSAARDMGLSLWNDFAWRHYRFQYEVGVYNGSGIRQTELDDHKDYMASFRFGAGNWLTKVGHWRGRRTVGNAAPDKRKWVASVGWGDVVDGRLWFLAEYLRTSEDLISDGAPLVAEGFYAAVGWRIRSRAQLVYRIARCWCTSNPARPRDSEVHTVTATYWISGQSKLMVHYDLRRDRAQSSNDADALRIFVSAPFSFRMHADGR